MKSTPSPQAEEIIELLKGLGTLKAEYPAELLAARRAAFLAQVEQGRAAGANTEGYPSQDQILGLLEGLKPVVAEYPAELLAARRAAFIAQIEEHNRVEVLEESPSQDQVLELLESLKPATTEYPAELLSARRAAFIAQIKQHNRVDVHEKLLPSQNGRIFKLLERLKSIEMEYPIKAWAARRSVFVAQIRDGRISVLEALRATLRDLFGSKSRTRSAPAIPFRRTSMIIATILVAAFMGSLAYGNRQPLTEIFGPSPAQQEVSHPSPVVASIGTSVVEIVVCPPGYLPPLCLANESDKSPNLTFSGNGSARPAVAKDAVPGSGDYGAAYVNDGLYGAGSSWVSNSAYSWIKIDLGKPMEINTIAFGRDRLGTLHDGNPGQFSVAVALTDNVYADGDSSNDFMEYTEVYDSEEAGFDGIVSGAETVKASFHPVTARFVKITFENARTTVDEIEAFMIQPPGFASSPTQRPRDTLVAPTRTPIPTNTLVPSKTPTAVPTSTPVPTNTATPRPTNTDVPTDTPVPPTDTPLPPPTDTPVPPTDTPLPPPTDTLVPTLVPPTDTAEPALFDDTETPEVLGP